MSTSVGEVTEIEPRMAELASSSTLGRRRRVVSGRCSVLDRGVVVEDPEDFDA